MEDVNIEEYGKYSSPDWDDLVKDLKGKHAKRMNGLLDSLPDKQFRIVYPKMLEFMMPKLQRQEIVKSLNDDNMVLRIEVITQPLALEETIIDITPNLREIEPQS